MSPFTLSLHLFFGRPRLLLPETSSLSDFAQMWLRSRLMQWPNHVSLLFSRKVGTGFTCASFLMSSFLMWSNLVSVSSINSIYFSVVLRVASGVFSVIFVVFSGFLVSYLILFGGFSLSFSVSFSVYFWCPSWCLLCVSSVYLLVSFSMSTLMSSTRVFIGILHGVFLCVLWCLLYLDVIHVISESSLYDIRVTVCVLIMSPSVSS